MLVVHVHVYVKPDFIAAFREATLINARASLREPGIARFDVVQDQERPEHFVLVEAYRTAEDSQRHKATPHYATWSAAVAPMMAQPRARTAYANVFPNDGGWDAGLQP